MIVDLKDGRESGWWARVDCGAWHVAVWPRSSAILVIATGRGNVQAQHLPGDAIAFGPSIAALYGISIDGESIRAAIEAGEAALAARESEAHAAATGEVGT